MAVYVKNSLLLKEIIKSKEEGKLTPQAVTYLNKIVKECSRVLKYKDPLDKEDCQAFAMLDILLYWNRFNPERSSNAFAFYSQIAKNGLAKGWRKLHPVKSTDMVRISQSQGIYNI